MIVFLSSVSQCYDGTPYLQIYRKAVDSPISSQPLEFASARWCTCLLRQLLQEVIPAVCIGGTSTSVYLVWRQRQGTIQEIVHQPQL